VADNLTTQTAEVGEKSEAASGPPAELRDSGPHRGKFRVVYLLLGIVLGGAIAGLGVLLARGGPAEGPIWSAWRPEGDDAEMAQQIAGFVGSRYRLDNGSQLVSVQAAPLRVQDVPIGAIAIRRARGSVRDRGG
jgi:hypothetical protein